MTMKMTMTTKMVMRVAARTMTQQNGWLGESLKRREDQRRGLITMKMNEVASNLHRLQARDLVGRRAAQVW